MGRCLITALFLAALCCESGAATGRVIKVLPHLLDLQGRHALSPSLYDRDAYQARLRQHRNQVSGIRFDVEWKTKGEAAAPLSVIVEMRGVIEGITPRQYVIEQKIEGGGWLTHWSKIVLAGDEYKNFGEVTAWRVTLWEGEKLIGEQKSFLW
jgi:hypothetical protein